MTQDRKLAMHHGMSWRVNGNGWWVIRNRSSVLQKDPSWRKLVQANRRRTIPISQLVPPPFGLGRHDVLHVRRVAEAQHVTCLMARGVLHGVDVVRRRELHVRERDPSRAT